MTAPKPECRCGHEHVSHLEFGVCQECGCNGYALREDPVVLERYGIQWTGPRTPISVAMPDGYWTPWHLAVAALTRAVADLTVQRLRAEAAEARVVALLRTKEE